MRRNVSVISEVNYRYVKRKSVNGGTNNIIGTVSMEGVTVCGHHPERRVTFGRGGPHIVP